VRCMAAGCQPVVGCNADATALKEAGNVAFQNGKHIQALELFSEAILKDPSSALLRSNRAGALASLGRHEEAFADAELCCKLQPDWWKGYTRRGHAQYHLKQYPGSEQSFLEALRLNPGEKSVLEALAKTRGALGTGSGVQASAAGPRAAAAAYAPPAAVFVPPAAFVPAAGNAGVSAAPAASAIPTSAAAPVGMAPVDFKRLTNDEMRSRLEQGVAKLSDEALDTELRLAGIAVPPGATRADKVKLYTQMPEEPKPKAKKEGVVKRLRAKLCPKAAKKSEGELLLEKRKNWLEEWNSWDDDRLVKRLARLGIDGDGLSRAQLLDELLQVETDRYSNRCNPQRIQKYALVGVGAAVVLTCISTVVLVVAF